MNIPANSGQIYHKKAYPVEKYLLANAIAPNINPKNAKNVTVFIFFFN